MKSVDRQNFINLTKKEFQPYYEEDLTDSDAVEIIDNFCSYMNLLIKCDKKTVKPE